MSGKTNKGGSGPQYVEDKGAKRRREFEGNAPQWMEGPKGHGKSRYYLELVSGRSGQTLAPAGKDTGSKINEKVLSLWQEKIADTTLIIKEIMFELNNTERRYLGLEFVQSHWDRVELFDRILYFDGDTIKKIIESRDYSYYEYAVDAPTGAGRSLLLPKTSKGHPTKLTESTLKRISPKGVEVWYFCDRVSIFNHTTAQFYYLERGLPYVAGGESAFPKWLEKWVYETTQADLDEIEAFRQGSRKHVKYQEGDFFAFKLRRRKWGFGRLIYDISARRKNPEFKKKKNYGLTDLMGRVLIIQVYLASADKPEYDLEALRCCKTLPAQAIWDDSLYYGEFRILGHLPLSLEELWPLESYGRSISRDDPDTVYLQYGLIYKEQSIGKFDKHLSARSERDLPNPYSNYGISGALMFDPEVLEDCIQQNSVDPYWQQDYYGIDTDLRNPANANIRRDIFKHFGLNPDLTYAENLRMNLQA